MEELEIYSSGSVLASTLKRADKILMDFRNCYYKKKKEKKKVEGQSAISKVDLGA